MGVDPYPATVARDGSNLQVRLTFEHLAPGEATTSIRTVAGRVRTIRNSGMFIDVFDGTARLQLFVASGLKGPADILAELDIGDFVAASGPVRRTPRGELTLDVETLRIISKAVRPMPDKHAGLRDPELRVRKRYLDIAANETSRRHLLDRSRVLATIRDVLTEQGFVEVETPMLQAIYGGAAARPFTTRHNALGLDLYLRIAPELYLKRLLIAGLSDRLYEIGRNFRNEGVSTRHNPEFTMLELYMAYATQAEARDLLEDLFRAVATALHGGPQAPAADGVMLHFGPPFRTLSMVEAAERAVSMPAQSHDDLATFRQRAAKVLDRPMDARPWGEIVEALFEATAEKDLVQPTHVVDFPATISPLAKRSATNPLLAERFETYCLGMEIANAFSEQNDPAAQRQAFVDQIERGSRPEEVSPVIDEDFLEAMEYGMPPAAGLGVGIDRLVMLMTNAASIREVIAFPLVRPAGA